MRRVLSGILLFALFTSARGEAAIDPTGHWEGTVLIQQMELPFAIDLVRVDGADLGGTISIPSERIRGLPLLKVTVEGTSLTFIARTDQPFTAVIAEDGRTMTGEALLSGTSYPARLTRMGDAHIEPPLTSPPIPAALQGTWDGTLGTDGGLRLLLDMRNRADGRSIGVITNLDEGGLRLPVAITISGSTVALDVRAVPVAFSGTLSADGAVLTGTSHENGRELTVVFRKRAAPDR